MDNHTGSVGPVGDGPQEWAAAVKCVTLLTILIMTLASNFFVLWAVLLRSGTKTGPGGLTRSGSLSRVQLFMVHLSVADILVALLNITPQLAWVITVDFRGGVVLCKLITYAQVLVLYLSTYILTGMSLDRLISMRAIYAQWRSGMRTSNSASSPTDLPICNGPPTTSCSGTSTKSSRLNNHQSRAGYRKIAKVLIALAWLLSSVLALPQLYIFSYVRIDNEDAAPQDGPEATPVAGEALTDERARFNCLANFQWHPHGMRIYVTSFVVIILGVPVLLMLFSYGYMCIIILRIQRGYESDESQLLSPSQSMSAANSGAGFAASSQRLTAAKVRLVKMTFTVVLCFVVCWSPFCIAQLVNVYSAERGDENHASPLLLVCLLLASLNSAVNPWIYAAFNATARSGKQKRQEKSMTSSDVTSVQSTRVYSIQVPMSRLANTC